MDVVKESGKAAPDPRTGGEACVLFKRASPAALWGVLIQGIRECCQIDRNVGWDNETLCDPAQCYRSSREKRLFIYEEMQNHATRSDRSGRVFYVRGNALRMCVRNEAGDGWHGGRWNCCGTCGCRGGCDS